MGEVISLKSFRAQRIQQKFAETCGLNREEQDAMRDPTIAMVLALAQEEDTNAIAATEPHNKGLKILRGNPRHQLLKAVFEDSLQKYWTYKAAAETNPNQRWYWTFPGSAQPYFLATTHVCRTHLMAINLIKNKADFTRPDADGHLPLYFIARYARDRYIIPALTLSFNVSANDSGRVKHSRGHKRYDAPIFRAIEYANIHAVMGLEAVAPDKADLNMRGIVQGMTPLIAAVLQAENALTQPPDETSHFGELRRRLWIVRFLASAPAVDPGLADGTGFRAMDYATQPETRAALQAGLSRREAMACRPPGFVRTRLEIVRYQC